MIAALWFAVSPSFVRPGLPQGAPNRNYVGNRAPLKPSVLVDLPVGAVEPQGWLRVQLTNEASGETGRLEEISPWLVKADNAWLSRTGAGKNGWEEVPYWLKGFGDLGYVLNDPRIIGHARVWIDGVLGSQRPDGYFGPASNLLANNGKPDMWPNMPMLCALQSYYEWSQDRRVLGFMDRYFHWQLKLPDSSFYLSYWEPQRGGDNMASVYWLYNRTGDPALLDLVRKIHRHTADWVTEVPNWHGVNFAQGFREPEEYAQLDPAVHGAESTESDYEKMRDLYGQVPGGMYGADENARPGYHDPRQAAETCAMVEMMASDEMLLAEEGNPVWGDRCEDVAFNSLPAALTADESALHYLTAPNLVEIDARPRDPDYQNGGAMLLFNPYDHRCCQHNVAQGWPYFAEHLWMGTQDSGLAATVYAPCTVRAKVASGEAVTIEERTQYPFRDLITFRIHSAGPTSFPLAFRIPAWAHGATLTVNDSLSPRERAGVRAKAAVTTALGDGPSFATVRRTWRDGDTVVLQLPMSVTLRNWAQNDGAISVDRGPLSYSLKIGEQVVKSMGTKDWPATVAHPAFEMHPTTPWNYGLVAQTSLIKVTLRPFDERRQPFDLDNVPVELEASARLISSWKEDDKGVCGLLPESPVRAAGPLTRVKLVPMGAARLRISEFPTVLER